MADLLLKVETARDFVGRAMAAYGSTAEEAAVTADVPLSADLYGIQSRGITAELGIEANF